MKFSEILFNTEGRTSLKRKRHRYDRSVFSLGVQFYRLDKVTPTSIVIGCNVKENWYNHHLPPTTHHPLTTNHSLVVYNQLSPCLLAVVSHVQQSAVHCINPECQRPYPQPWGNKFCNSCGAPLLLLDRYVPLQRLGSGGFAHIYTVWDQKTQTEKVLKVLVEDSPKARELFAQEAAVLKGLRHPGVPRVESDGYFERNWSSPKGQTTLPCLVMEKINGQTLEEIQQKYPQGCPQELVLNWLTQAVEILEDLHKRKIVHRDIKPSNLMLREKTNQLVLIDFGGVKQVSAAMFASQPRSTRLFSSGYSPPETNDWD